MDDTKIIVSLDIGTTAMKVVVASATSDQVNVIGVGSAYAQGMNRGVIVDLDKAAGAIKQAVKKAASQSNTEIHDVIVGLPVNGLQIFACQGMIALSDQTKEIDDTDVRKVLAASLKQTLPPEQEYVALIPNSFSVDGFKNVKDPRGMIGSRLEFSGILYSLPQSIVHNCLRAVRQAGLNSAYEVLMPLAGAQLALDSGEQNFGSVLIDFGGGQTTATVIHDHKLKFTTVDAEGGNLVTHDISVVLNTSLQNADKLQRYYGKAEARSGSDAEKFPVTTVGQDQPQMISSKYLAAIIEARLQQILSRLEKQLVAVKALDLPGGIVLTGGLAELSGIETLTQKIMGVKVKTFIPNQMGLRHPAFTESLGLVSYAQNLTDLDLLARAVIKKTVSQPERSFPPKEEPEVVDSSARASVSKSRSTDSTGEKLKNFWKKFFD
ncbi:cell division protein FtsA [Lactobacillus sp. DCY120]|uniref:Cell division protein FtsA n=1 Tax=Bombilactobacillus apium TaxID=2675299 RepID=A0A850RA23_9LACO|nr:cell division protein FtsA [Bombilactobacillus apium]NVY95678.1 cell division protein FtsA [Bombilactobacillus apium]